MYIIKRSLIIVGKTVLIAITPIVPKPTPQPAAPVKRPRFTRWEFCWTNSLLCFKPKACMSVASGCKSQRFSVVHVYSYIYIYMWLHEALYSFLVLRLFCAKPKKNLWKQKKKITKKQKNIQQFMRMFTSLYARSLARQWFAPQESCPSFTTASA